MSRVYAALAVVALVGGMVTTAYVKGRSDGATAERLAAQEAVQELNEELRRATDRADEAERERLAEVQQLERTVEELRDEAIADPNADRPAVGVDSVRRLNAID